jgi:hypothetical protein
MESHSKLLLDFGTVVDVIHTGLPPVRRMVIQAVGKHEPPWAQFMAHDGPLLPYSRGRKAL